MKYIILFFLVFTCLFLQAKQNDFSIRRVSPLAGLTSEAVNTITQDQNGFIWIGTNRGLFKYDSERFESFSSNTQDSTSVLHNVITDILVDNTNKVWVATRIGLCVFDRKTRHFSRFDYRDDKGDVRLNIKQLALDRDGNIWLIDNQGLGILNKVSHRLFRVSLHDNEKPNILHFGPQGQLWVGTNQGSIFKINPETFQTTRISEATNIRINTLYVDATTIYTGDSKNGLLAYRYNGKADTTIHNQELLLQNQEVRVITKDNDGQLWIGTYNGIYLKNGESYTKIENDQLHPSTYTIFEDKHHGIWIGTWAGGLFHYHPEYNLFSSYIHTLDPHSLSNNVVSSFDVSPEGNLLIGTEAGGMNLFDRQTQSFTPVTVSPLNPKLNIKDQCFDVQNGHWVATNKDGLWYKASGATQYTNFKQDGESGLNLLHNDVYALTPVDSGIWIGTHGGGLHFYHLRQRRMLYPDSLYNGKLHLSNPYIKALYKDTHNYLWVGTVNSLNKVDLKNGTSEVFGYTPGSPIRNDYIYSISQPFPDEVWIGTRISGINIYNHQTHSFTHFNANGLLKQKDVYGIIKDTKSNLWITTNDGLILHDIITNTTRRFTKEDGIQGNWFYPNAIFQDESGTVYFGGTQGFSTIHPNQVKFNKREPQVTINKITINNQTIKYPLVTSNDTVSQKMKLKHFQRTLSFEFTSDNYLVSEKNQYKYRLVNHYDDWIETNGEANVLFTNLDWGHYIFEVKSCNNDGLWCQQPARIQITIPKPFYAQNITILGYLFIIALIILYIFRIIKKRIRLENMIQEERNQTRQAEELNDLKLKFFTNVSHEFRTPLSLILGPVNTLLKDNSLPPDQQNLIQVVHRNATRMMTLINQLMDLRKLERGKEKLTVSELNLDSFIHERTLNFSTEAKTKNITFSYHKGSKMILEADSEKLDFMLINLLSNAFKFTPENGNIEIAYYQEISPSYKEVYENYISFGQVPEGDTVSIIIADTGLGIDQEELKRIFNRFERGKNPRKGSTGIGLSMCLEYTLMHRGQISVYSSPAKGSLFQIVLPLKQENIPTDNVVPVSQEWMQLDTPETTLLEPQSIPPQFDKTILVVEDNTDLRNYIRKVLDKNYTVQTAPDGKKALELLLDTHIDLVISDVMMPEMDGMELCQTIKSDMAISHIPVILLTALSSIEHKLKGVTIGADAYVSKPFQDVFLIAQVNNLLVQRQKLSEHFAKTLDTQAGSASGLDNYFLSKLNKIIEANLTNEELDVEVFTNEIGISRSHLHRKLKSLTNYSTTEYIRTYRLEKALELMKSGEYNINEISYLVGFNTHTYFSRCFKKHFQKSPKEIMKEIQQNQSNNTP